jgi:dTDP-4-amino-4,6-dideoxygalactose transaminase
VIAQSSPLAAYQSHKLGIDTAIRRCLDSGWYVLGEEVKSFEAEFSRAMASQWALGVANGTDAIELSLRALGIGPGDCVVTVSHTAVATAAAIIRIGAKPLFVDIEPRRYTMDPVSLEQVLQSSAGRDAKALVVVHLYGLPADMPAIMRVADAHALPVIEDCAQAHGASACGRPVGSWGRLACYSFYPTKNLAALGDGGAVTGNDAELADKVRFLREYGWRKRYVSDSFGFNSRLDELQAAILRAKLPTLEESNARRRDIAAMYDNLIAHKALLQPLRYVDTTPVFHQYVIEVPDRDSLRAMLQAEGISTLVHYPQAVHQQPAYSASAFANTTLSATDTAVKRILSLPMYPELSDREVESVADAVMRWCDTGLPA